MKIDYDKAADVLYITFLADRRCRYVENGRGQILRIDIETSELVGLTIPMFSRRLRDGEVDIPEIRTAEMVEVAH